LRNSLGEIGPGGSGRGTVRRTAAVAKIGVVGATKEGGRPDPIIAYKTSRAAISRDKKLDFSGPT